jgi:hypothetical protein
MYSISTTPWGPGLRLYLDQSLEGDGGRLPEGSENLDASKISRARVNINNDIILMAIAKR